MEEEIMHSIFTFWRVDAINLPEIEMTEVERFALPVLGP